MLSERSAQRLSRVECPQIAVSLKLAWFYGQRSTNLRDVKGSFPLLGLDLFPLGVGMSRKIHRERRPITATTSLARTLALDTTRNDFNVYRLMTKLPAR